MDLKFGVFTFYDKFNQTVLLTLPLQHRIFGIEKKTETKKQFRKHFHVVKAINQSD